MAYQLPAIAGMILQLTPSHKEKHMIKKKDAIRTMDEDDGHGKHDAEDDIGSERDDKDPI